MKQSTKILILFISVISYVKVFAQDESQNYIRSRIMLNEDSSKYIDNIQYYDGLGRPSINLLKNVTSSTHLITLQEYEGGRESKKWLPHITNAEYIAPNTLKESVSATYSGDTRPFAQPIYENSPLDRVIGEYSPGVAWENHPTLLSYLVNTDTGELSCKKYGVNLSGELTENGLYAAGSLYVTKKTDEDGNLSYVFTNQLNHEILTRQITNQLYHDTYYVYDMFDNQCFVLPPTYQDSPSLALYAYQFKYDKRRHCIEKTLPGCQPTKYVYDKGDKLIFSQDGVQRSRSEWTFYLYDNNYRIVLEGVCNNSNTASATESLVETRILRNPTDNMISKSGIGNTGYSSTFTITSPTVHIANYYDDYSFLSLGNFPGEQGTHDATGLLTGSMITLLNSLIKIRSVAYYDIKGRPIKKISSNHLEGTETTTTTYTFTGKPHTVKNTHTSKKTSTNSYPSLPKGTLITEMYTYNYDHAERLKKVTHQLNENAPVTLSENTYDNLGRLLTKTHHETHSTSYTYNIRNWLTSISGAKFTQNLNYNTGGNATPCYNGNISSMSWKSGTESTFRNYNYSYDQLNRLNSAIYLRENATQDSHNTKYDYDKMGNITSLKCSGSSDEFSNLLTMIHNGNQLKSVKESASSNPLFYGTSNFVDGADLPIEYTYDANGNLIQDANKYISQIKYNALNLPEVIHFKNEKSILNSYSADGVKRWSGYLTPLETPETIIIDNNLKHPSMLSVPSRPNPWPPIEISPNPPPKLTESEARRVGAYTDYCKNIVYEDMKLAYILTEEGYITLYGTTPTYHYYLRDHQGNNRVVINQNGAVEEVNHYRPFGGLLGENSTNDQPYKFGNKQFERMHGLDWYDFSARMMDPTLRRFISIDPLCEKYYSISPYAYCANNPINAIDPDGRSTWVMANSDGSYRVVGGDLNDKDRNIYVWGFQKGKLTKGESIGITTSTTSFYNSDDGIWETGSIIDPSDNSGNDFLEEIFGNNPPMFDDYIVNARNGKKYDFKVTNGTSKEIKGINKYRGMPIGKNQKGQIVYTSARDIGNIAAGYVAGANSMPWSASRVAFDAYQSITDRGLKMEGISTRNAEYYGWRIGYNIAPHRQAINLYQSISSGLNSFWNNITK